VVVSCHRWVSPSWKPTSAPFIQQPAKTFVAISVWRDRAWKAAGLQRITLHECRHTFASIAIAAGVNIGTVSAAMGHSSVKVTWDRYHHLMPGTMDEAAERIQNYIARRSG
jgi:integrase